MAINEDLNKVLKEMWRLDEKREDGESLTVSEIDFYNNHLEVIKTYYKDQSSYWQQK